MRDYSKVNPKFWIGKTGKALRKQGIEALVVGMYLMTAPNSNMLGLYYLPSVTIAHETGLGLEGASKGLRGAIEAGFCAYDSDAEMVWVFEMAAYQIANRLKPDDKRCIGIQNDYDDLPENEHLRGFYLKYAGPFNMKNMRDFGSSLQAPCKPLRSQEQEQEQEQEQKQEQNSCTEPQSDSTPEGSLIGLGDMDGFGGDLLGDAGPAAAPAAAEPTEPAVLLMPLVGKKEFGITQTQIDEWAGAYPGVDVIRQLAAMRQWCLANPTRRKTQRGVLAFCNSWLVREQDKAPARPAGPSQQSGQRAPFDLRAAQDAANAEAKRRLGFTFGGGEVIDAAA